MPSGGVERKLAAILAADVAGYSRLIGLDEEGTLNRLKAHRRELIDPKIAEHKGRVVKTTGDGILIEFPSVVAAVRCAVEIQRGMVARNAGEQVDQRIEFRVGIHQGDIVVDGADILGDGVNVAARLEAIAEPGGICVTARVHEDAVGRLNLPFEDMGEQQLKNIARSVRVYRVTLGHRPAATAPTTSLALPDKPSIAVLPFTNMSGDSEQEYFADGVVEEIITALSRFRQLFVIARNSTFTYKGRAVDVKQVGRELGVRYVLEGSVRKATNRVRITGQLIDASTGAHLWADRFDGAIQDIFELQDQVTASVVGAILPKLEQAEVERTRRKPTESLDAYDYYLRALVSRYQFGDREACAEALRLFMQAIELDAHFASAYAMAAGCYLARKASGWTTDSVTEIAETARLALRAVELGKDDAFALAAGGIALAYVVRDLVSGAAFIDRALQLNPNLATAWDYGGWIKVWLGEPDAGIERFRRGIRLSPLDPSMPRMQAGIAHAYFFLGDYEEATKWSTMALRERPDFQTGLRIDAPSQALAGRLKQAQRSVARLQELNPALRIATIKEYVPCLRSEDIARYQEGMRKAGLPE